MEDFVDTFGDENFIDEEECEYEVYYFSNLE